MSFTSANQAGILKTLFPTGRIKKQLYERSPFFAMVPKDPTMSGKSKNIPIVYTGVGGRSASFAKAQTNRTASAVAEFALTTVEDYATVSVTRKLMLQTRNDKGARLKALEHATNLGLYQIGRSLSHGLYGNGYGTLGQISSGSSVGTSTITLADTSQIVNFEVGMKLVAAATEAGALRSSGATATISAVNRDAGTLTVATTWSGLIAAIAAGDYLFADGDAANGGSSLLKMSGLAAWLPASSSVSASAFFGVDRSADKVRLAGTYRDVSTFPAEEALIELQSAVNINSLGVDTFLCNPTFKRVLQKALSSKVNYQKRTAMDERGAFASVSFETVRIEGDKGPIDIVADPDCPSTLGYPLRMSSWCLHSMLDAPHIVDEGTAQEFLRLESLDEYEERISAHVQFGPREDDAGPGDSGVGTLPTA